MHEEKYTLTKNIPFLKSFWKVRGLHSKLCGEFCKQNIATLLVAKARERNHFFKKGSSPPAFHNHPNKTWFTTLSRYSCLPEPGRVGAPMFSA